MDKNTLIALAVAAALDWVWDKLATWRERKARDEAIETMKHSLKSIGEDGQKIGAAIDRNMDALARTTNRWSKKRWTLPPADGAPTDAPKESATSEADTDPSLPKGTKK